MDHVAHLINGKYSLSLRVFINLLSNCTFYCFVLLCSFHTLYSPHTLWPSIIITLAWNVFCHLIQTNSTFLWGYISKTFFFKTPLDLSSEFKEITNKILSSSKF